MGESSDSTVKGATRLNQVSGESGDSTVRNATERTENSTNGANSAVLRMGRASRRGERFSAGVGKGTEMRIGFFGGAFDPFHLEHRRIMESARDELRLDRVIVYPSYIPPHKKFIGPYPTRRRIVELSIGDIGWAEIDDIEFERERVNPTYLILPELKRKYAPDEGYFLLGGDSLRNFHSWRRPDIVAKTMKMAVCPRAGEPGADEAIERARERYGADITALKHRGSCVSGSLIKAKIMLGDEPEGLNPDAYRYILEQGAYSETELTEKLRKNLTKATFEHSKRTVYCAIALNATLGLEFRKVFLASLLHDCAKNMPGDFGLKGVPAPAVHQFAGAIVAEREYMLKDAEALDAIRYHTTGKKNMTELGKLVYCADMLEEGRTYPEAAELRRIAEQDFERGFRACVNASAAWLEKKGVKPHYLTAECAEYYNNRCPDKPEA